MRLVSVVTRTRSPRLHPLPDLADQVVHLALGRADLHLRVHQPGRADDLLDHLLGASHLIRPRRGRGVDRIAHHLLRIRRT